MTNAISNVETEGAQETRLGPFIVLGVIASTIHSQLLRVRYQPDHRMLGPEFQSSHSSLKPNHIALLKIVREEYQAHVQLGRAYDFEADLLVMLDHPGIIRSIAKGMHHGRKWIALEDIQGGTILQLREALEGTEQRLHPNLVVHFISEMADALIALHNITLPKFSGSWVTHGSIQPGNILLDGHGALHIYDFSFLRTAEYQPEFRDMEDHWRYQSPENSVAGTLGPPADIYSLGLIAHELVTGVRLFSMDMSDSDCLGLLKGRPRLDWAEGIDIPVELQTLICEMTTPNPAQRIPNAQILKQKIHQGIGLTPHSKAAMAMLARDFF